MHTDACKRDEGGSVYTVTGLAGKIEGHCIITEYVKVTSSSSLQQGFKVSTLNRLL